MIDPKEIDALIQLLDDPDEQVFSHVAEKISEFGQQAIPFLEQAWETKDFGPVFQERLTKVLHQIQYNNRIEELKNWAKTEEKDLFTGTLIIAKYQYPDLDEIALQNNIDEIEQAIWLELNDNLTALEQVRIINHILYDVYGFEGNTNNYHSPANSYINTVLESRKGSPILLAVLYIILAQRLKLPIFGVNLPRHFILAYTDEIHQIFHPEEPPKVLFYINAFSKGGVFSKNDVAQFIAQLQLPNHHEYYNPCGNLEIIQRILNNLIYAYKQQGNLEKVSELEVLLKTVIPVTSPK